jgi:hypothetical protein
MKDSNNTIFGEHKSDNKKEKVGSLGLQKKIHQSTHEPLRSQKGCLIKQRKSENQQICTVSNKVQYIHKRYDDSSTMI